MFRSLVNDHYPKDPDYPDRMNRIRCLEAVLDGTMYDVLHHDFSQERVAGNYVPINHRRPSIRYNICRLVVRDSSSLLFGDGHWPTIDSADEETRQNLKDLVEESQLNLVMLDAVMKGSTGSVAIMMRIIDRRVYFEAFSTKFLTPVWDPKRPDRLKSVVRTYKVKADELRDFGYVIDPKIFGFQEMWFRVEYTDIGEIWYLPQTREDKKNRVPPTVDEDRTTRHGLGFCPVVWIKNLPGGDAIDGASTFGESAVNSQMEIEYQLSQAGRGLRYSSDPLLMIREPPSADEESPIERTGSSVLKIDAEGDAKLLEISGSAAAAVIEYVKFAREALLETLRGTRASPEKLTTAQSGRAIELLYQPLIWLADDLRASYGNGGLLALIRMAVMAQSKITDGLLIKDKPVTNMKLDKLSLRWPQWFEPTPQDRLQDIQAISAGRTAGVISRELGVKHMAPAYDNEDVDQEIANINADIVQDDARQVKLKALTTASLKTEQ
jgi:hypothetical protein